MPYLQVELDALKRCPDVARVTGLPDLVVTGGLVRMWAHCWECGSDVLRPIQLVALFGCRDKELLAEALEAFGFLEPVDGGYRVKGAARYLRLDDGRSKGGKAAAGNLIPGARQKARKAAEVSSAAAESQPRSSREEAEKVSRLSSALTPSTEHRTPRITTTPPTPSQQTPPPLPLVERVAEVFLAERGAEYAVTFSDEKAGRALLAKGSEDEVLRRWAIGLRMRFPACNSLSDLLRNWNAYAAEPAQEGTRRPAAGIVRVLDGERCTDDGCEAPAEREPYGQPLCERHALETEAFYRGQAAP